MLSDKHAATERAKCEVLLDSITPRKNFENLKQTSGCFVESKNRISAVEPSIFLVVLKRRELSYECHHSGFWCAAESSQGIYVTKA